MESKANDIDQKKQTKEEEIKQDSDSIKDNQQISEKLDLTKLKTLFAFDNSGSISGNSLYFNEILRIVRKYYKVGDKFYLWGDTYTELSKSQIDDWIKKMIGTEGTYPINIAKLAKESPNHREHLIIVTDGDANEEEVERCYNFLLCNNIKFKFVSVYNIGKEANLSVGFPFCKMSPFEIVNVLNENQRVKGPSVDLETFEALEKLYNISFEEFNNLYEKLYSAIEFHQLNGGENKILIDRLFIFKERIIKSLSEQQKNNFEEKFKELFRLASRGTILCKLKFKNY